MKLNKTIGTLSLAALILSACQVEAPKPDPDPNDDGTPDNTTQNTPPVATSEPNLSVDAGDTYWYTLTVTDADNDTIQYSAVSVPSWLTFSTTTGVLHGTPTQNDVGDVTIELGFSDGTVNDSQTFTLTVNETYLLDPPTPPAAKPAVNSADPSTFTITAYGAGNISDGINPTGYGCVYDHGHWIYNAGVVKPGVSGCNPIGAPTKRFPQVIGDATQRQVPTHKWWGSLSFHGEMTIGDPNSAAYITPDPITARVSNLGVRVMGIPAGLGASNNGYLYQVPDPFSEVFDGIAVANSDFTDLDAYVFDYSDASVTVQWQDDNKPVMRATFVHGSPYIYFKTFRGDIVIKTKAINGNEKGVFYDANNSLGVWTSVAGNRNNFLITGEGDTTFTSKSGKAITVSNDTKEFTLTLLPDNNGQAPSNATTEYFAAQARHVVAKVNVSYSVDQNTNEVTVTHDYLNQADQPVTTIAGLHPLHWKNSNVALSNYKVRSARGMVKFATTDSFSYTLPFVGVLPYLPSNLGATDLDTLQALVYQFIAQDSDTWNTATDTYWAGKNYGKVAELAAIADSIGMDDEAALLIDWLKVELSDWFTADTNGTLDTEKYFVYDEDWDTLLGLEESFASHQQLNDHHFHYGYFVRAAAEICRQDANWCSQQQYGPMIELLIRDFAGSKDDDMFPYLRNFDPANGFSWASGNANFALGNNNESTSEAANAYGAIVLYGLITGNNDLVEKGMYLHASSTSSYWEYWNNIDGYLNNGDDNDNFPSYYNRITTSIIWGHGSVFSTWFSAAYAHILGIQGLPTNPLNLHIGQHATYMEDYVALGLEESSNGKPSGLIDDMWRDIWWNLWAMTDAEAAIADYNTMPVYDAEAGETKAHTYQWIHAWKQLGHLVTGTGDVTSNDPTAVAFDKNGVLTYLAYNYSDNAKTVSFSDGHSFTAAPHQLTISLSTDIVSTDVTAPTTPSGLTSISISQNDLRLTWVASTDDRRLDHYDVQLLDAMDNLVQETTALFPAVRLTQLEAATNYTVQVRGVDSAGNVSGWASFAFTTASDTDNLVPLMKGGVTIDTVGPISASVSWLAAEDNGPIDHYSVSVTDGAASNFTLTTSDTNASFDELLEGTAYTVTVMAEDDAAQQSNTLTGTFTTTVNPFTAGCTLVCVTEDSASSIQVTVDESNVVVIHYTINGLNQQNVNMTPSSGVNTYTVSGLSLGDKVGMSFTVIPASGGAYDTAWDTYVFTGAF